MNLVKIGNKIFNLDNVTDFTIKENSINICYAYAVDGATSFDTLEGRDAEVFKYWLSYRVSDADRDYQLYLAGKRWAERDTELYMAFHAYQEAGGELEAAEWIVAGEPIQD